ncbi:hypothetical protein [Rhizobium hidalgonense]|uniref:Uncharacterized protein n=1 Tax=Rhizobium hidalgonense TaxID=1538159 RepID=A0ABX4JLJ9_9HYPH|nr:hypothetical protein [Rhizobium hidalgonense]PDT20050.1 hypothetical protein CO674_29825 [Rhizobium hidalgonense]PON05928.1 hypothetical protein ATY29_19255 [Rhizobium hidalgonense]
MIQKSAAVLCLSIGIFWGAEASGQDDIFQIYDLQDTTGYDLGRGFDVLTASPRGQCVVVGAIEDHVEFGPVGVNFRSYRIENSQQLDKVLGISASASIKFGVGSANASASYSSSVSLSSYTLNYVVEASVRRKGKSVQVQDLQERYKKLLFSGNPNAYRRFRAICGDGYISEMPVGGDFKAVIQITTSSQKESEQVAASMGGSYSIFSGAASFSSAVKKVSETNEVRIWSFRRGGEGPVPITADDIASNAANLPVSVKDAPAPVQIAVINYIGVVDDPMLPMATFTERAAKINLLGSLSAKARDQSADARYILDHPNQFFGQPSDLFELNAELAALNDFRKLVSARADECVNSEGYCMTDDLTVPLPIARPARR